MVYATEAGFVKLEDLLGGNPKSFVRVHTLAFASLIFSPEAIRAENVAETLLFDLHRLGTWQRKVKDIGDSCTALVLLKQYVKGTTAIENISVEKVQKHFASLFVQGDYDFGGFSADLCQMLDDESLLMHTADERNKDRVKLLQVVANSVGNPKDAVSNLM